MLIPTTLLALLLAFAFTALATPEPCADRVAVIKKLHHIIDLSEALLKEEEFAEIAELSSIAAAEKSKAASAPKVASTTKIVKVVSTKKVKAAAQATTAPAVTSSSRPASSPVATANKWSSGSKKTTIKKKAGPVVKDPTPETINNGTAKAIDGFANSGKVPESVAKKLQEELQKAIDAQLAAQKTVTQTEVKTIVSTLTANVSEPVATAAPLASGNSTLLSNSTLSANGTLSTSAANATLTALAAVNTPAYITITSLQTQTIYTNDSLASAAALNIQKALESAFAAANLSQSDLDASTTASLEACLTTVLASGGMPDGYSCLTSSGADSAGLTSTLNTILEQFVGILPNVVLSSVFDAVTPLLGNLLPASEAALIAQIQDSIQSVIASLSGNSVTALEQVQTCYTEAVQMKGNSSALACITKSGGALSTLQTASNSVLEQFVGVLPASLTTAVQNILTYNIDPTSTANQTLAAEVSAQISNAINSVASTLSGNTVTLAEILQGCAAELIATGNATAAEECITKGDAPVVSQTIILGIAQQFAGYLPSSFFTDLTDFSSTFLNSSSSIPANMTQAEFSSAISTYFDSSSYGPSYVTCLAQVEACVTNAVVKTGSADAVCPGPVDGCETEKTTARRQRRSAEGHQRAPKSGLVVTVNPGSSAFFAGEIFTATITFANASLPDPATSPTPPPASSAASLGYNARNRPPSASHQGLAEYATSHLDQDGVPPSPAFGSTSGNWRRTPSADNPTASTNASQGAPPRRPSFASTLSGGALATPKSANFGPTPIPPALTAANRSVTGGLGSGAAGADEKGKPLPTRKGLIGKPIPLAPPVVDRKPSAGGLYGGGPRRPGGARGHGRSQSLAFSSPDLTGGAGGPTRDRSVSAKESGTKSHGRSRLGGSMGGDLSGQLGLQERKGSARGMPTAIEEGEEPTSPTFDDAAFPPSQTTSTPALQIQRPPSHPKEPPHSAPAAHPYGTKPPPLSPDAEDSDSGSDYDPADSHSTLPGHGFYGIGQNETMESVVQLDYESRSFQAMRKASSAGPTISCFDQALRPPPNAVVSRNAFFHPPNTLSLLWSFAHLEGTFEVDDTLIKTAEFVQLKKELLGGLAGVGGGTLEDKKKSGGGGGWKDWIWGTPSSSSSAAVGGASLEDRKNESMKDRSIPTFSSPPSILGVDLVLEPGESKSYTFSIRVPADLPPSFRGKSIKFSYHLVVGTSRSKLGAVNSPLAALGAARDATSRVMRVPVRVYNHVGVTGARPFYDLTNPIVYHRDEATTADVDEPKATVTKRPRRPSTGRQDFYDYAANLLDCVATSSPELVANAALSPSMAQRQLTSPTIMESVPSMRPERRDRSRGVGALLGGGDEEEGAGCKNAVEIVTRNSQKVSYDINKDGYMVASLTLVKSAYRLGETVNGSVVINSGDGRVLRVSARLETYELIETTIATKSAPQVRQITRRLHAEHHETTLDSARLGFALAIPSGATPDFGTSGVKLQWSVRLSFLVIPPSPDAPLPNANLSERDRKPGPNRLPSSMANGTASATRHGRSKSFAYGFEPAVPLTLPAPPMITPTGAAHLMPVLGARDISSSHTSYRAVPDLGFVPVLFSSNAPEPPPAPGPLQRSASGASLHRSTGSLSASRAQANPVQKASVVLVPAKVDTVECSIPIKVYPGNTPFRPTTSTFAA